MSQADEDEILRLGGMRIYRSANPELFDALSNIKGPGRHERLKFFATLGIQWWRLQQEGLSIASVSKGDRVQPEPVQERVADVNKDHQDASLPTKKPEEKKLTLEAPKRILDKSTFR